MHNLVMINLLAYSFYDAIIFVFLSFFLVNLWIIYYHYNNNVTNPKIETHDYKVKKNVSVNDNLIVAFFGIFILAIFFLNLTFMQKVNSYSLFWDSFYLSNKNSGYQYLIGIVFILVLITSLSIVKQNVSFSIEYMIFVALILVSSVFLISSTNLFLSIFILELIALLIFGKFTTIRSITNFTQVQNKSNNLVKQFSYGLLNSLFFQFWANFVSSAFLFFSLINIHYMFGSSNFFLTNYFLKLLTSNYYLINTFISIVLILFITGLFIKLGIAPYQFFKIEVYKGLPIYLIIIYTTIYLVVYIIFFIYLYISLLTSFKFFTSSYVYIIILISMIYLTSLLFDTKNFKAFLSYSTLITVINLLVMIFNL